MFFYIAHAPEARFTPWALARRTMAAAIAAAGFAYILGHLGSYVAG
jgi:hypothetical protein